MNQLSLNVSRAFMETIANQLTIEPRAEIVKRYYLLDHKEEDIADDLELSIERVRYHLKIFRLMLIKSLRQLQHPKELGEIPC